MIGNHNDLMRLDAQSIQKVQQTFGFGERHKLAASHQDQATASHRSFPHRWMTDLS
jgi:hypothetical protein